MCGLAPFSGGCVWQKTSVLALRLTCDVRVAVYGVLEVGLIERGGVARVFQAWNTRAESRVWKNARGLGAAR